MQMHYVSSTADAFLGSSQGADWTNYNRSFERLLGIVDAAAADPDERRTRGTHSLVKSARIKRHPAGTSRANRSRPAQVQPLLINAGHHAVVETGSVMAGPLLGEA